MSQQPAEEHEMDTDTTIRERLIAACDLEPIPADVLDRIRRRVMLAHASRYARIERA